MASIATLKKQKYVKIYNHGSSVVIVTLERKQDSVPPKNENGIPGYISILWDDLRFLNDTTNAFRLGTLRFAKDDEEAIYKELGIFDYKDILLEEDIEEIILHPTAEGLQKIIDIASVGVMERAMGVLTRLTNKDIEISPKVANS